MRENTVQTHLTEPQRVRVDAWRRAHEDPPTRAVAVQRLLNQAIDEFIPDDIVELARSMPSMPLRRGRPAKRTSIEVSA
jgi:hypothetical protein